MFREGNLKAQAATEFMMIFIILVVAILIVGVAAVQSTGSLNRLRSDAEVQLVLSNIVNKINTAVLEGEGFEISMTLPERIMNSEYKVIINSNRVQINLLDENGDVAESYVNYIITENVVGGSLNPSQNQEYKYNIKNDGGEIKITVM